MKPAPFAYHRPGRSTRRWRCWPRTRRRSRSQAGRASCRSSTSASPGPRRLVDLTGSKSCRHPAGGRRARRRRDDPAVGPRARARDALPLLARRSRSSGTRRRVAAEPSAARSSTPTRQLSCLSARLRSARSWSSPARAAADGSGRGVLPLRFMTALEPGELLVEIRFPRAKRAIGVRGARAPAGDFAVVCVAVAASGSRSAGSGDAGALGRRRA